jgi:hypothetical protein
MKNLAFDVSSFWYQFSGLIIFTIWASTDSITMGYIPTYNSTIYYLAFGGSMFAAVASMALSRGLQLEKTGLVAIIGNI